MRLDGHGLSAIGSFLLALSVAPGSFGAGAPPWVLQAAGSASVPGADATVLLDETELRIGKVGKLERLRRRVVRIATEDGAGAASELVLLTRDTTRVLDAKAWLLGRDGKRKASLGLDDVFVMSVLAGRELHDETSVARLSLSEKARPGDVFATEWLLVDPAVFAQETWIVGGPHPTVLARFSLRLLQGWSVDARTLQGAAPAARRSGKTWIWEHRDLPATASEPMAPPAGVESLRLGVSWFPPGGTRGDARLASFADWAEVSAWLEELAAPSAALDPSLRAEAQRLVAGTESELERLTAIAERVQGLRYVSVQLGTGRGGGYAPSPASEVLARGHGDCKDKTTLMRALLAAVGIEAWPVVANVSAPELVRSSWPSPHQFDHCILAARAPEGFDAPAVAEHPRLGRLLYFDPTDEHLPLGRLPLGEGGGQALLVGAGETGLSRLPEDAAAEGRVDRLVELRLEGTGAAQVTYELLATGARRDAMKVGLTGRSPSQEENEIETWALGEVPGMSLVSSEWTDDEDAQAFRLELEGRAPQHARLMGDRVLRVPPSPIPWGEAPDLGCDDRSRRLRLPARSLTETVRLHPPGGFVLDERPPDSAAAAGASRYRESAREVEGVLVFTRELDQVAEDLAPGRCAEVAAFLAAASGQGAAPAVYVRR